MSDPRGDDKGKPEEEFASGPAQREAENFVKNGAGSPKQNQRSEYDSDCERWWRTRRPARRGSADPLEKESEEKASVERANDSEKEESEKESKLSEWKRL